MVERLTANYPAAPPATVSALVHDIRKRYDDRPLRDFILLFVERNAKRELAHMRA